MIIPQYQWAIITMFLVLVPFGVFYLADELSNGQVFIEQDDPSWEQVRQGAFNNTVLIAVSLDTILFVIWFSFNAIRQSYEIEEEIIYNADGGKVES